MEFQEAADRVKKLKARPSNDELLTLYALFKQGSDGDATGSRPSAFKIKERAKYDAWTKQKGTSKEDAKAKYIALVQGLEAKLGTSA